MIFFSLIFHDLIAFDVQRFVRTHSLTHLFLQYLVTKNVFCRNLLHFFTELNCFRTLLLGTVVAAATRTIIAAAIRTAAVIITIVATTITIVVAVASTATSGCG